MDYEKKYKEALETARLLYTYSGTDEEFKKGLLKTFPELRESEDERIRKDIVAAVEMYGDFTQSRKEEIYAYLEKQKEQNFDAISSWLRDHASRYVNSEYNEFHHCVEYDGTINVESLIADLKNAVDNNAFGTYEQKGQKPAENISQLTVQGKGVYKICPRCKERMVRDDSKVYTSMPPQYGYTCPKCGTTEFDTVMYDTPEIEEQKPALRLVGDGLISDPNAHFELENEQKPAETSNIDLDTKVNAWVGYTLNDNAQSYSRKDVQIMLDNCARYFYDYAVMCLDKPAEWIEFNNEFKNQVSRLLASVLNKEWEYNKGFVEYAAQQLLGYAMHEIKPAEWSEEDERMRQTAIEACKTVAEDYENSNARFYKCKDWLEYRLEFLHPQSHWKPSEEQMYILNWVANILLNHDGIVEEEASKKLQTLYNDLKRL